jgi:hypothetical protein
MSERRDHKKSKRRRKDREEDDTARGSGVNYSKVADRHVDDDRYEKHRTEATAAPPSTDAEPSKASGAVSAQMAAVMRVMAGQGERTIAEKLADSNRPTWEQYKKDNEDKLNIEGLDQKKMEEYRKQLDEQREKLLHRGTNHRDMDKKSKKKKKRKHHKRHEDSYSDDSSNSSDDSSSSDRKKKKHRKRKKKSSRRDYDSYSSDSRDYDRKRSSKKRKKDKRKKKTDDGSGSGSDGYRLSAFFNKGSDDDSK